MAESNCDTSAFKNIFCVLKSQCPKLNFPNELNAVDDEQKKSGWLEKLFTGNG